MDETLQKAIRKNNKSAWFYLVSALLTVILTLCFIVMFMMVFGFTELIINAGISSTMGDKYVNKSSDFSSFLVVSKQFYVAWIVCAVVCVVQLSAFVLMIKKSRFGRKAGIIAFFVTLLAFPPLALVLIYPFAFLTGNDGKYFYQYLTENYLEKNL